MKNIQSFLLAGVFSLVAAHAQAQVSPQGKGVGIGFEVGAPTTLNLKMMTSPYTGIVVGIGGAIWYDLSLSLHADYLWHPAVLASGDAGALSFYAGLGGWTALSGQKGPRLGLNGPVYNDVDFLAAGVRVPLGLSFGMSGLPIEVFGELVPAVALFPGIGLFGQGGLGARLYF
jgi:hypothetical protein